MTESAYAVVRRAAETLADSGAYAGLDEAVDDQEFNTLMRKEHGK